MKRFCTMVAVMFVLLALASDSAWAQPGGRGGFRGGPGGFGGTPNLLDLANIEAVQKEIEAQDEQLAGIKKLNDQLRAEREAQRGQGQRANFQNMSDEERQKAFGEMRERREKQTASANAKLAEILLPHQIKRIEQISLQTRGLAALSDPKIAAELKISDEQKKKLEEARNASMEAMRAMFQGGNRDQDREQMRAKMQDMRKQAEEKVLAVLTADQKAQFEKMKGESFQMPEGAFGPGSRPGRGGEAGRGNRTRRPNN
ncbi:MAG: hypothetical protein GX575_25085 [Candidatus Anammoximicrobium sp.]|nr:hypothetical protein [Candidatus Anammoximicrobium sp.]